jgi:hypothetical protein
MQFRMFAVTYGVIFFGIATGILWQICLTEKKLPHIFLSNVTAKAGFSMICSVGWAEINTKSYLLPSILGL